MSIYSPGKNDGKNDGEDVDFGKINDGRTVPAVCSIFPTCDYENFWPLKNSRSSENRQNACLGVFFFLTKQIPKIKKKLTIFHSLTFSYVKPERARLQRAQKGHNKKKCKK